MALELGGECKNGHLLTAETLRYYSGGKNRPQQAACLICERERKMEYKNLNREKIRQQDATNKRIRNGTLTREQAESTRRRTAPEEFGVAMETTATNCNVWFKEHPDELNPWTDYGDDEDDEHLPDPPTAQQARALCEGCPLLVLCGEAAIEAPPYHGVRAGMVFNAGKRISRRRKKK